MAFMVGGTEGGILDPVWRTARLEAVGTRRIPEVL
jgi:hypothetical protein